MYIDKVVLIFLTGALLVTDGYSQGSPENHQIKNITGTVISTDSVGNTISIRTHDQKQVDFSVPNKAVITQDTHNIGLMDIGESSSVSIEYFVSSSAKNIVISIVDNEPVVNE